MKKLCCIFLSVLATLSLSACSSDVPHEDYDTLYQNYSELLESHKEFRAKNEELNAELSDLQSTYDSLQSTYDSLKVTYKTLQTNFDTLQSNLATIQAEFDSYKEKMQPYETLEAAEAQARQIEAERIIAEQKAAEEAAAAEAAVALAAEEAKGYETGITYDNLARRPDDYKDSKVKFTGKVLQVLEGDGYVQIRFAIDRDYDKVVLCEYNPSIVDSRILEDDIITIYGVSMGTITYQSAMNVPITVPAILIDRIDQ